MVQAAAGSEEDLVILVAGGAWHRDGGEGIESLLQPFALAFQGHAHVVTAQTATKIEDDFKFEH
jgi:hypothetical protein